jgi:hypothetical protein
MRGVMQPVFVPPGANAVGAWAQQQGLRFEALPDQRWFREWEPFETIVAPAAYYAAASWSARRLSITVAEPWTEEGDSEPVDRTLLAFASHPELRYRASMRAGDHFLTRVTYVTSPPPPQVKLGDAAWDEHVITHAASARQAAAAFTPRLRGLLQRQGFRGHLELRAGGAIVYLADRHPVPAHYQELLEATKQIVASALERV